MIYRNIILFVLPFLLPYLANAQSQSLEEQQIVENSLRAKFSSVQYHSQGGGWYLLSTMMAPIIQWQILRGILSCLGLLSMFCTRGISKCI